MSDLERRARERAARTGGTEAALRAARALERVGDLDGALAALLAHGPEEPLRAEVARLLLAREGTKPLPARREPAVAWVESILTRERIDEVVASPLGIVARTSRTAVVVEPDTGKPRLRLGPVYVVKVLGDTVLGTIPSHRGLELTAWDIATGERRRSMTLEHPLWSAGHGLVVVARPLRAFDLADWTRPLWTTQDVASPKHVHAECVLCDGSRRVLDRATGRLKWQTLSEREPLVDADPEAILVGEEAHLALRDASTGLRRWWKRLEPKAILGETVLARDPGTAAFLWLDRATGRKVASMPGDIRDEVALARDVLYRADRRRPAVEAFARGERLWRVDLPKGLRPASLVAAGHGSVVAVSGTRLAMIR